MYLIKGGPGTGKTTLGIKFLLAGLAANEPTLYLALSQTDAGLYKMARSHGWSLDGAPIHSLTGASPTAPLPGKTRAPESFGNATLRR